MSARRALITGIGGQDGSLLAELLLDEGYEVYGVVRRAPSERYENLEPIRSRIELLQADLLDQLSLVSALRACAPEEVYNLASVSFVPMSWSQPVLTGEFAAVGVTALLEAIRLVDSGIRFYQASSSEIFGDPPEAPQTEETPLSPLTPYGVAKAYAHFITRSYRRRYELHACSGILYNHESPRRPLDFVTRKVAHAAAAISLGLQGPATRRPGRQARLGVRGRLRARDVADAAPRGAGRLRDRDRRRAQRAGPRRGRVRARGVDWRQYVHVDESLQRGRAELHNLIGDASKARDQLGWAPTVTFEELISSMVDADLARLRGAEALSRYS
jgi:GDPmannose 4,6-dehydratase